MEGPFLQQGDETAERPLAQKASSDEKSLNRRKQETKPVEDRYTGLHRWQR